MDLEVRVRGVSPVFFEALNLTCNFNDTLENVEKCKLVPFQVCLHWFPAAWSQQESFPFHLLPSAHTPHHYHTAVLCQILLPKANFLLQVYIAHPCCHTTYFAGAQENFGFQLFKQLLLLLPPTSSTLTLAVNEFTSIHLKTYSRRKQFMLSH